MTHSAHHSLINIIGLSLAPFLLIACAGAAQPQATSTPTTLPQPTAATADEPTATPIPPTETPETTAALAPLEEIEDGLLGLEDLDQLVALFNADAGKTRLILHLTMGCPSCLLGAEWVNDQLLEPNPDADLVVYAIWFPTLGADALPVGTDEMWDSRALDDPRVVNLWDQTRAASKYFATEQPYDGPERRMLSETFAGLQWGRNVWDIYFLYGPDAMWADSLSDPLDAGYPIIEARDRLRDALALSLQPIAAGEGAVQTFAIVPAESSVSYGVQETFSGLDLNYAIGSTNQVSGEIMIDQSNPALSTVGPITINIESLSSDNWRRDERIQMQFLESAMYPVATFTPTALRDLPDTYMEGDVLIFAIDGTLTVRDTDAPATFAVEARIEGGRLIGTATGQVLMTDFGFDPPRVGDVIQAENEVDLTFRFVAEPVEP